MTSQRPAPAASANATEAHRRPGHGGAAVRVDDELVAAVAEREPELGALDDAGLEARVAALRRELAAWWATAADAKSRPGVPDPLLAVCFAVVRETARRALGLRLHDVQIAGGIALHQGAVVEMATGEGKTLAAVAPAFLAALAGRGSHVLTYNDYLARRDAEWMAPAYRRLGVAVGAVAQGAGGDERRRAYSHDVTYVTAKEAGFDLLRDGLCLEPGEQVHRPFFSAIVDEADSILIDEARVPLVIAGGGEDADAERLRRLAELVRGLARGPDYELDEHAHNVFLTDQGALAVEDAIGCGSLVAPANLALAAEVRNALHAEVLLERDVDYIVRAGTVELVDELTGRVAENRHWPDGLQAAVEAKEGLALGSDGIVLGSITLQHFLRLYPRLAGMTATASAAAEELREVYELEVVPVPPHRPCVRIDRPDRIYASDAARDRALLRLIEQAHRSGRPVLVGTRSVADSERLALALLARGVPHQVLNAKHDRREAAIVAEAGAPSAVTISTNMAGRGTDIRLGGADEKERDRVVALGGLAVVGIHRHESARIDDQLRGRSGRQGDPGSSELLLSLEDPLLRRYGIDRLLPQRVLDALRADDRDQEPLDSTLIRREIARTQRIAEGESLDIRRRLYRYSEMLERQRRYVAEWRQETLDGRLRPHLLRQHLPERWRRLEAEIGAGTLGEIERRLTLLVLDRAWSQYLADHRALRDEIHLVSLDGRDPLTEFTRSAMASFEGFVEEVERDIVATFAGLEVTGGGVDWEGAGLRAPASTWTYLVSDQVFAPNVMRGLANRAAIGLWGSLLLGPVLFVWGLWEHWRRRRSRVPDRDPSAGSAE